MSLKYIAEGETTAITGIYIANPKIFKLIYVNKSLKRFYIANLTLPAPYIYFSPNQHRPTNDNLDNKIQNFISIFKPSNVCYQEKQNYKKSHFLLHMVKSQQ